MSKGLLTRVFSIKTVGQFSLDEIKSDAIFVYSKNGFEKLEGLDSYKIDEAQFADPFPSPEEEDRAIIKLLLMAINANHTVTAMGGHITWTALTQAFNCFDGTMEYSSAGKIHGPLRKNPIKNVIINPTMTKMLVNIGAVPEDKVGKNGGIGQLKLASRQVGSSRYNEATGKMENEGSIIIPERRAGIYVTKQCPEMAVIMAGSPNNIGYCIQNEAGKIALLITNSEELGITRVESDSIEDIIAKAKKKGKAA